MICRTALLAALAMAFGQSNQPFAGTWKLNPERSEIRGLPAPPDTTLRVEASATALLISGQAGSWSYPLDGSEKKQQLAGSTHSTRTKWEGAALLVNTLVSGPQNYTIMERWRTTRDGSTLTIRRTISRLSGESESVLVYENTAVQAMNRETAPPKDAAKPAAPPDYVVDAGTRVLLRLVSSVNTKTAAPGDRIYLETDYPVLAGGRVVIPRGSYVAGTVTEAQRAGRVKGKASLYLRFDSLTLPNGVTRSFLSRVGGADTAKDSEGKLSGEGTKGRDARTVGETASAGASVGSIAGRSAAGAGIGAAAGAAAGLIGILGSRGADLILPKGSTMELVLDRELRYSSAELNGVR